MGTIWFCLVSFMIAMYVVLDGVHAGPAGLPDEERRRIYLWLDGNGSFYGTYGEDEELAQKRGERIPPPRLQ